MKNYKPAQVILSTFMLFALCITILIPTIAAKADSVFELKLTVVEQKGDEYVAVNKTYSDGDTIYLKAEYHTPYQNAYENAVDGVTAFDMTISAKALKTIKPVYASTMICTDVSCSSHDTLDVIDFDAKSTAVHMTYGYSGYIVFSATAAENFSNTTVTLTMCYGGTEKPIHTEKATLNLKAKAVAATPTPQNTVKPSDAATTAFPSPGTPITGDNDAHIVFAVVLLMFFALLLGIASYRNKRRI